MRLPSWLSGEIETAGVRVLDGRTDGTKAAGAIADLAIARDPDLVRAVVREFFARKLRKWVKSQLHDFYAAGESSGEPGGQMELFTALPRLLETSPGRFAHISTMTGPDWDSALRQADVKADNSGHYAKAIRRAYDQVRPLLSDDDSVTTADVADKLAGGSA